MWMFRLLLIYEFLFYFGKNDMYIIFFTYLGVLVQDFIE